MKVIYSCKYFQIIQLEHIKKRKTEIFAVINSSTYENIGKIQWKKEWRSYTFYPEKDTIWDGECLDNIVEFLREINFKYKSK